MSHKYEQKAAKTLARCCQALDSGSPISLPTACVARLLVHMFRLQLQAVFAYDWNLLNKFAGFSRQLGSLGGVTLNDLHKKDLSARVNGEKLALKVGASLDYWLAEGYCDSSGVCYDYEHVLQFNRQALSAMGDKRWQELHRLLEDSPNFLAHTAFGSPVDWTPDTRLLEKSLEQKPAQPEQKPVQEEKRQPGQEQTDEQAGDLLIRHAALSQLDGEKLLKAKSRLEPLLRQGRDLPLKAGAWAAELQWLVKSGQPGHLRPVTKDIHHYAQLMLLNMAKHPHNEQRGRAFLRRFLPITHKLLHEYSRLQASGGQQESVSQLLGRMERSLQKILRAFVKTHAIMLRANVMAMTAQLDALDYCLDRSGLLADTPGEEE